MPMMGTFNFLNIVMPLRVTSKAADCGVVTITTPSTKIIHNVKNRVCDRFNELYTGHPI